MVILEKPEKEKKVHFEFEFTKSFNMSALETKYLNIGYNECTFGDFQTNDIAKIRSSFTVSNTTPAISGRDMLSGEELRNYIKYNWYKEGD